MRWVFAIILAAAAGANAGCSSVYYYGQAIAGQMRIMAGSRDIDSLIDRQLVNGDVARRLALIRDMRRFSVNALHLPDNDSYSRYMRLDREHVVWNVFAAPEFSTTALTWCFPVAGCVAYRGYFSKAAALRFAERLKRSGHDVYVGGVDAYSTLGWLSDPVLSSFIDYPESLTAALLFHELAHQVVYVPGDTAFNESFATAVADAGVRRWFEARNAAGPLDGYRLQRDYASAVRRLMVDYRERFDALYAQELDVATRRVRKQRLNEALYLDYLQIGEAHGIERGRAVLRRTDINNALVASFDLYNRFTSAFAAMLERRSGDFARFYEDVRALADKPRVERHAVLESLISAGAGEGA